ncbi:MAG: hypothetical protein L0287_28175 [Anaerolineae bacterium]|nr:hypothetical protein [Anaerolineae bacterium]MCI0607644.1 hypothetical protein [Anaerolineae bacterium]
MNKQSIPGTPNENKIEELLTKIQPVPSEHFHEKMKQAIWRTENFRSSVKSTNNHRMRLTLAIAVLLLLTGFLISPQGRAWAQEVFQFFQKVNFTSIPLSEEEKQWMNAPAEQYDLPLVPVIIPMLAPEMASLAECQESRNIQSYACQVAYAESKLGMDLKEFSKTPEGWIFKTLNFDATSQTASFIYTHYSEHGADFVLRQGTGKFPTEYGLWSMVPASEVETVVVGSFAGEYVQGTFSLREGDSAWRWDSDDWIQRLAWSDGKRWYYIQIFPPGPGHISRDKLVELAAGLVDSPTEVADPLNPDSLASIANAEEYSGLDLKAPTVLPLGFDFSYARYFPFNNEVHLHYKYGEDLVIYEWKGNPDNFDPLAKIYKDHEIVKVNGNPAFYGVPEAVSQYESSYLFLAWHDENLNYRIYFYFDPSWGGGILDKDKMITIAESMDDINDYKRSDYNSYDYVAIYEKALGFDAKEFLTTPDGWLFTNVNAYPECISTYYSAVKENGELILMQCKTDQYIDTSNIPSTAIESVKLGESNGLYIVGGFELDNNGRSVWKSDTPIRQLYWQEDDLWIQIIISGDSVVLHDKEDLISYAESLR